MPEAIKGNESDALQERDDSVRSFAHAFADAVWSPVAGLKQPQGPNHDQELLGQSDSAKLGAMAGQATLFMGTSLLLKRMPVVGRFSSVVAGAGLGFCQPAATDHQWERRIGNAAVSALSLSIMNARTSGVLTDFRQFFMQPLVAGFTAAEGQSLVCAGKPLSLEDGLNSGLSWMASGAVFHVAGAGLGHLCERGRSLNQPSVTEEWSRGKGEASASSFELARSYWKNNQANTVAGLKDFLRIPSISSLPEHSSDMQKAATSICEQLSKIGMEKVTLRQGEPGEHPLVTAEWMNAPGKPTLLFYAHYDVQPVDPVNAWKSPPFEPTERDGKLFARGSADDKGHLYMLMKTLDGYLSTSKKLPVNVKLLFEGEEESSGTHVDRYVRENQDAIKADAAVVLDEGMFAPGLPTIETGLRGIVRAKVTVTGADHDLHSGEHGGAAPNAAQCLSEIISSLHRRDGKVNIPHFYDDVVPPSKSELQSWRKLPFDEELYKRNTVGSCGLIGQRRFSVLQRLWSLPTVEVNGMSGGYSAEEGFKTIIPSQATANLSMRLAPGMDPDKTGKLFEQYIRNVAPAVVKTEVTVFPGSRGIVVNPDNVFIQSAAEAFKSTFNKETAFVRDGASIPIAETLQTALHKPILITGVTLPDAHLHAPDENLDLGNFHAGIEALGKYMENVGQLVHQ